MRQPLPCARFGLAGVCALGLLVGGCGGGGATTTVIKKTVTVSQPAAHPSSTSAQAGQSTEDEPPTRTVHLSTFRSPTGNIGCVLLDGVARCDIAKRAWSPPSRPASCPNVVDFGQGLDVGRSGPGRFVCAGDTALDPTGAPLAYGSTSRFGGFSCASRSIGMTCTNPATGHGFFISIQSYRVY